MLAPGIRFNDCVFSEPTRLDGWTPPKCAGLFGIIVADPNWAPKPYQVLYFGEFGNNAPVSVLLAECPDQLAALRGKPLMVSVLPLPFSTTSQRCALRSELIRAYNPVCQTEGVEASRIELARKLDEVRSLLANVNRMVEQPTEPKRRSYGFLPPAEPDAASASGSGSTWRY